MSKIEITIKNWLKQLSGRFKYVPSEQDMFLWHTILKLIQTPSSKTMLCAYGDILIECDEVYLKMEGYEITIVSGNSVLQKHCEQRFYAWLNKEIEKEVRSISDNINRRIEEQSNAVLYSINSSSPVQYVYA